MRALIHVKKKKKQIPKKVFSFFIVPDFEQLNLQRYVIISFERQKDVY
ncbi:hypothetical protein KKC_09992 [Listeria fleischmannii subsp. coloradonensis]|nr:hypothetical protein KKC_09992 [Listeria fleischmannii subsp. coloradonensis]